MTYNIDLTEIILALLGLIVSGLSAWVTSAAIPWLKEKRLYSTAKSLCAVALTTFEENQGKQKFDYVFEKCAERFGNYFDETKLKEAIQSAYVELCNELGKAPSKAVTDIK